MDEYDIPKPPPARPDLWPPPVAFGADPYSRQPNFPAQRTPTPRPQPQNLRSSQHTPPGGRLRGTVGGILTALGLFAGSLAVAAFVFSTLILNPDRPGQVLKAVLTTDAGRSVATEALSTAIRSSVPTISKAQADRDAAAIIASPALPATLGTSKANVSDALLTQLRHVDPAAAAAVSKLPTAGNPLTAIPGGLTSAASKAHSALRIATIALLVLAVALVGLALLVGPSRDRILIRVGYWAIAASAVQLLIWFALPKLLGHFTNGWAQVAVAALRAGGSGLIAVFGLLAALGVVALGLGYTRRLIR